MKKNEEKGKKTERQMACWIELKMPENIDISSWLNPDGSLNVEKMQAEIKKDLMERHRRTMEWQRRAIRFSVPSD